MNDTDLQRRVLPLDNAHNFRDAGGYPTRDGRRLAWGKLWRGEGPHNLTETGHAKLLALGIRSAMDLRTFNETEANPSPYAGGHAIQYFHRPIWSRFRKEMPPTQLAAYRRMFEERENMRDLFVTLAARANAPLLIHCTAGKDRTGVVVMMLHELAGVSHADQLRDYLHTATLMSGSFYDGLRARAASDGIDLHKYEDHLKCVPETFEIIKTHVNDDFGGVEKYLRDSGVSASDIAAIRAGLIT